MSARKRLSRGEQETYGGQRYSVEVFERFLSGADHVVVSLDAPAAEETEGSGRYVGIPARGAGWVPARWKALRQASKVVRELERFGPSHLLLRANEILGCQVLQWAGHRNIPTAVIVATRFDPAHAPARRFCRLANQSHVLFVGNHNRVAAASLVQCGLRPDKAVAWDYPPETTPDQHPPKSAPESVLEMLFAGSLTEQKGVLDTLAATQRAHSEHVRLRLAICGEGPLRASLERHAGVDEDWLEVPGLVPSAQIRERMRQSWVVVVPTRPEFPEALPLVITEALTTRTPVVMSDHPIFREYFIEGRGVRFFRAGDPDSLARVLVQLAADPGAYRSLSESTLPAWQSLQIECHFHHLIERLERAWHFE